MSSAARSLIKIGIIVAAHGVKGQVKIRSLTGIAEDLLTYTELSDSSGRKRFKLKKQGVQQDLLIAGIEGVGNRNAAETLKGMEIYTLSSAPQKRKKNQWTYRELTGLKARLKSGKHYGKVIAVYNFGAGEIIEIELAGGETEMLPFTDDFTGEIDLEKGTIVVIPPDYVEACE